MHPFRNSFGLIELCRLSQDTRLTSDSCSSGWSFVIGFLHQGRCLPRLARLTRPSPVRADSGLSPHRHTCVAGRSYKMPALLSDSGHSVFAYAKSYRGPSPGRYNQSKSPPVRSVVILQRDDRVAGDESFRARSGGNPWCGNIRWNPFQRSCRPDTVFFPHSTCCAFQAKSKSRSAFSSSVDA